MKEAWLLICQRSRNRFARSFAVIWAEKKLLVMSRQESTALWRWSVHLPQFPDKVLYPHVISLSPLFTLSLEGPDRARCV